MLQNFTYESLEGETGQLSVNWKVAKIDDVTKHYVLKFISENAYHSVLLNRFFLQYFNINRVLE